MKVLFLTPLFYPSIGGVQRHVFEVGLRLKKKDIQLCIITEKESKNYQSSGKSDSEAKKLKQVVKSSYFERKKISGIPVWYFTFGKAGWHKKFKIWYILFKHRNLFKDADIIHCHDVFIWYLPLRFLYPRKKVFITFHGYESYPVVFKNILIRKISEILSSGNICVGNFIKKWYHANATYITYGGVNIKKNGAKPKREKSKKLNILFLGRIDEDTGVRLYINVLEKLKKQKLNFNFIACGDGYLGNLFEKYGKVTGFVKNTSKYIREADIVFSSSYLSILESLAERKKVFAVYQNPLKKSYLTDSPFKKFIVITRSVSDITKKISLYNKNKKIDIAVDNGFLFAKKQTWENVTNMYINLWTK